MMDPSKPTPLKFDMKVNPAYQIDWMTTASGKLVAATKRRVLFKFGFSSRDAIEKGMAGSEARGEEHDVGLIWSLTSGKRVVLYDGKEVHYSMGRRGDTKFETSWPIAGGHTLTLVAHAAAPLRATPGFKQYDLLFDGTSFFNLPRIFEVGIRRQPSVAHAVDPTAHDHAFARNGNHHHHQQEETTRRRSSAVDIHGEGRSMSSYPSLGQGQVSYAFAGPVRRATMEVIPADTAQVVPAPLVDTQDALSESSPSPTLNDSQSSMSSAVDEFAPRPPTFQQVSNHILSAYRPPAPTAVPAPVGNPHHTNYAPQVQAPVQQQQQPVYMQLQQQQTHVPQPVMVSPDTSAAKSSVGAGYNYTQQDPAQFDPQAPASPAVAATPVTPTMTMMRPLEVDELRDNYSPTPVDGMDQAMHSLVNLHDIFETRTSPEQIKAKKQRELNKSMELKGRPRAPVATDWHVGKDASLADIQKHKKPVAPPTKEVMKVHAFDPAAAQAGMMVVYGQQQQQQPPPQASGGYPGATGMPTSHHGFAAGGRMHHHGYNQPVRSAF